MALLFMDGFDKYGSLNNNTTSVSNLLAAGEWSIANIPVTIVAGLSSPGYAIQLGGNGSYVAKTLATNYARLIGGFRFSSNLAGQGTLIQFRDGSSAQCSICIESTGVVNLRSGNNAGTILSASSSGVSANTIHYVEWDITFSATGAYQVWLDGVSVFSGTGNTRAGTANNYANNIMSLVSVSITTTINMDDFYLFDSTGTANNAVLLTSPRVETTFPISDDGTIQFGFGSAVIGNTIPRQGVTNLGTTNLLFLRAFVPIQSCTLNSIGTIGGGNSAANLRGVVYADSSGIPGTLLSSGPTVAGTTANATIVLPLTTPQSLVAGTRYWLGYMIDLNVNVTLGEVGAVVVRQATVTFTSGAPGTAPVMSAAAQNYLFWGNVTGTGVNYYEVSQQPTPGLLSYVSDSVVGHEDLFNFNPLSVIPLNIYAVSVKGYIQRSDSGSRTVSLRAKSGTTDSGGSATGQSITPGNFNWYDSTFTTDPNTGLAWTGTGLNAATSGYRIDS